MRLSTRQVATLEHLFRASPRFLSRGSLQRLLRVTTQGAANIVKGLETRGLIVARWLEADLDYSLELTAAGADEVRRRHKANTPRFAEQLTLPVDVARRGVQ